MSLDNLQKLWNKITKKPTKYLAIDVAQGIAKIVYFEKLPHCYKVYKYYVQRLTPSEDAGPALFSNFVQTFLTSHNIEVSDTILSLSDADVLGITYLTVPDIHKKEDLIEAVKEDLKEEVLFEMSQAYIDWQNIRGPYEEEGQKKKDCAFVVMKKDAVDEYLNVLLRLKLNPICVTTNALAYSNLLNVLSVSSGPCAVLDLDYQQATLTFFIDNKIHFSRNMPISWEKITQSLTEILVSDKGKIELSDEEAEEIKNTIGFPLGPHDENKFVRDNVQLKHVVSMLRPILEVLVRELKFSFDYYAANFNVEPPGRLYITGGGADLKRLDEYLTRELKIEVYPFPIPDIMNLEAIPGLGSSNPEPESAPAEKDAAQPSSAGPTDQEESKTKKIINASGAKQVLLNDGAPQGLQGFGAILGLDQTPRPQSFTRKPYCNQITTLLGAALSSPQDVNLLPTEIKRQKMVQFERMLIRIGSITAIFMIMILFFIVRLQIQDFNARINTAEIHLSVIKEIEEARNTLTESASFQNKLSDGYVPLEGVLRTLSSIIPRQIILRRVSFAQGTHKLSLDGVIAEKEDMAEQILTDFMQELEKTPFITEATLLSIEGVGRIQNFSIVCDVVN